MRLTVVPPVIDGESAAAYLLRAFDINGEPWSSRRLRLVGHPLSDILQGRAARPLMDRLDRGPEEFRRWTPVELTKRKVVIADEQLHRDDWTTSERRWCPSCWMSDLQKPNSSRHVHWNIHRRFWWDVAAIDTCPLHMVRLATNCPICGVRVTWDSGSLTRCRHGHSLLDCDGVPVTIRETLADAYIVGRLGGMSRTNVPVLCGLTLAEACDAMERLGVTSLGGATGTLSKFPPNRYAEIYSLGLEIARDWPHAFNEMLDKLARAGHVGIGAWGAERIYGYLYIWAKQLPMGASGDEVRGVLFSHFAAQGRVRKDSVVARHFERPPLAVRDLVERCGRTSGLIAGYVKALGAWPEETKRGTPIYIAPETADQIYAILERAIGVVRLCDVFGLAKTQIEALVEAGIITACPIHRLAGVNRNLFDIDEVSVILGKLRGDAPTVNVAPGGLRRFAQAAKSGRVGGVVGLCRMILAGTVHVKSVLQDAPGLAGFLVDPEEIKMVQRSMEGGGLTLRQAGRRIGVPSSSMGMIVRTGLLSGMSGYCGQVLIPESEVESFRRKYILASEIAPQIGSSPRWVRKALEQTDFEPKMATDGRRTVVLWPRQILTDHFKLSFSN